MGKIIMSPVTDASLNVKPGQVSLAFDENNVLVKSVDGGPAIEIEGAGSGAGAITDLSDVTITDLQNGDILSFSGSQWINTAPGAGSGDMFKSIYDSNNSGVVDDSEKFAGYSASYFFDRTNHTGTQNISTITNLQNALNEKESTIYRGTANGYCELNSFGKVPASRLDLNAVSYKNSWNASTNSPALSDNMIGATAGDAYIVGVSGSQNLGSGTINFLIGDLVLYNSTSKWEKVDGVGIGVSSINGEIGAVTIDINDVSPLTSKGELIVHNGFTSSKISPGTNGQILVVDSTSTDGIKWASQKFETVISYDTTTEVEDYYISGATVSNVTKSPGLLTWQVKIGAGSFSTPSFPFFIPALTEVIWKITYNTGKTKGVLVISGTV